MIRVVKQKEPDQFDALVRKPGLALLKQLGYVDDAGAPVVGMLIKTTEIKDKWNLEEIRDEFRKSYNFTCAYLGIRILTREPSSRLSVKSGDINIDHFLPKVLHPQLAYEWDNYRPAHSTLNSKKQARLLCDPFTVDPNWFFLDRDDFWFYPSFKSSDNQQLYSLVLDTCSVLNDDDYAAIRKEAYDLYDQGDQDLFRVLYPSLYHHTRRWNCV